MKKIIFLLFITLTSTSAFSATIAVMPYRIDPPLEKISGKDYSKLLSVGIILSKNIEVVSPEEVEIAMAQTGVNVQNAVSAEDLQAVGLKCRADLILIGTIRKSKGVYSFDNVLYSMKNNSVLSRNSNKGNDIYKLAHQEIKDTLITIGSKKTSSSKGSADIAFVTDMSYSMSTEWEAVRDSILEFSSSLISRYGVDTKIYLVPYSSNRSNESVTVHHNSVRELKQRLNELKPGGTSNTQNLISMLNYALTNIKWRRDAAKEIMLISNSKTDSLFLAEKYSADAKRRDIRINTISGGRIGTEYSDAERLAELTGGRNYSISYHQRVHDASGGKHEIYLQRGRVFHSLAGYQGWRDGILLSQGKNPKYVKTPSSMDEIYVKKTEAWPEKIMQIFIDATGTKVIEKNPVQSNAGDIMESLRSSIFKSTRDTFYGKALISDGKLSMWIKIRDPRVMQVFQDYSNRGFYVKAGFNVRDASAEAYGVELIPVTADITSDYVTDFVRTSLTDIVKNKGYYTSKGIGTPPVWFVEVKIENVERFDLKQDVRD